MKYLLYKMTFCTRLINPNINRIVWKDQCKKFIALCCVKSERNYSLCCTRSFSTNININRPIICRENFIPFETMVEQRRSEARRSIVIEVHKKSSVARLEEICAQFGNIKSMAEFVPASKKRMVIVEFEEETSLNEIVTEAQISSNGSDFGSIQIPFLKLNSDKLHSESSKLETRVPIITSQQSSICDENFMSTIMRCNNLSEQIQFYYETQAMTEIGWRLRFLTCRKIEWVLPGVLSHLRIIPFGSSVNTFGNNNCDLDMIIDTSRPYDSKVDNFPFIVQSGTSAIHMGNAAKNLEMFADMISFYMPGFTNIQKILHARVPIIKCNETFTGLECDITVGNKTGYFMSELLYLYGCSDPRVRPLISCIRLWSKGRRLTRKNQPGMWFSNFTTTALVLFFLMNTPSAAVIPPLEDLEKLADKSFTCEGMKYSYVRDVARFPVSSNTQNLEELLGEFFHFYANFNYKNGLSILTGKSFTKPMNSPLFIQNPIEQGLNVSRNINWEQLETFREECTKALGSFNEYREKSMGVDYWGLPVIMGEGHRYSLGSNKLNKLDINSIFDSVMDAIPIEKRDAVIENPKLKQRAMQVAKNLNLNISKSTKSDSQPGETLNFVNIKTRKKNTSRDKDKRNQFRNYKF